jgi:hypothetical protein
MPCLLIIKGLKCNTMIDNASKHAILKKIIESKSFKKADKYGRLLTYLVKSTIDGNIPKEYSIAVDVFERGNDFNPSEDTIVRYYMHRLRQKITAFYEDEGKNEEVWLVIPKGHYEVKFEPRPKTKKSEKTLGSPQGQLFLLIIGILLLTSVYYFYQYTALKKHTRQIENPIKRDDPVWSGFFANKLPTTLLIGDHFIYQEYDKELKRDHFIIDYNINIKEDFERFKRDYPTRDVIKLEQGSLPLNSIFNLQELDHVFYSFSQKVNIELSSVYMASQFDLTKINDQNIIYIGGFRNLRNFNYILDQIQVSYKYSSSDIWRGEIIVPGKGEDSTRVFKSINYKDGHYSDLGIIAKVPGNKNENYLVLTGFAYPAQIEIVQILSRNSSLESIYEQTKGYYETFPEYFYMIVEVDGLEYSALEWKVKYFKEIIK